MTPLLIVLAVPFAVSAVFGGGLWVACSLRDRLCGGVR